MTLPPGGHLSGAPKDEGGLASGIPFKGRWDWLCEPEFPFPTPSPHRPAPPRDNGLGSPLLTPARRVWEALDYSIPSFGQGSKPGPCGAPPVQTRVGLYLPHYQLHLVVRCAGV